MEARTGIAIALLLVGCTQPQISDENSEPIVAVSPTIAPRPAPQQREAPRRLKLRLTLDRPEDLKIKVGDLVVKGQVISDRPSARANLIRKREVLQRELKQLPSQSATPNYAVEQAEVEQAQLRVKQARVAISNFYIDSPWTDYARQVLPITESTQLGKLKAQYQEVRGELAIAQATLQVAQQRTEVKGNSSKQQAELLRQIREIEKKLDQVGVIKSLYSGRIKSIKWLLQTDKILQVELAITVEAKNNTATAISKFKTAH
ncbi:MAG: efflux RND transporter periplasmic adaptor subunit [Thermosynechococcaceae cyanobacterium]